MATGVRPRDEDIQLSRTDLEAIQDAMKNKKFRDMLADYVEEIRDPANQALYQKEMTQLEKERGYDVTFINPKGGYVIKTSVAGDRKAFINICSNDNVGKPACAVQEVDGRKGMNWQIPYSLIPPRDDFDHKKQRCVIYDVVYHPDTLRMAAQNKQFRELVNKTAFDALKNNYDIHLDNNNFKFTKSSYKGMVTPAVVRKEDPDYKPTEINDDDASLSPEMMEKLYPQHSYSEPQKLVETSEQNHRKRVKDNKKEFVHETENGYTIPKYIIKQQKNVDLQDFTYHKDSKQYTAIPSHIIIEVNLPLLSSTKNCVLDVREKTLSLTSEKPAKYKLELTLPYSVNDDCGTAKFDKSKHKLIVTLPVIKQNHTVKNNKVDSGVESEENSGSQSDEDLSKENLIEVLDSKPNVCDEDATTATISLKPERQKEVFLEPSLGYILPPYTHNVLEDTVAFTFHVKNTEPESVKVMKNANKVYIKFTSIGSGFVPVHYAALVVFNDDVNLNNVSGEAWDNNVILQIEVSGQVPESCQIGVDENSLITEAFDVPLSAKAVVDSPKEVREAAPTVEVTNLGTETNIMVSSQDNDNVFEDNDNEDDDDPEEEREIHWVESDNTMTGAKSILRKPMSRSYSESSVGDVASSMDYISSDCIPEESSLKKTVRFSNVIARQFYRYNSSIEGQKKKNQRKKSKKRNLEQRRSESEAEEDSVEKMSQPKSSIKPRRDSGLADTSDADTENKNTPNSSPDSDYQRSNTSNSSESVLNIVSNNNGNKTEPCIWETEKKELKKDSKKEPPTCDSIKHNTDLYNPDNLNKGRYLEVKFKNDLIFDLDM